MKKSILLLIICTFIINNSYAKLIISFKQLATNRQLILIESTKKETKTLEICTDNKCETINMDFKKLDAIELIRTGQETIIKI